MNGNDLHIIEIIERCKKGEISAQVMLYKQYSKAMFNIALRFLNNKMDAEDILQESFITAFEKLNDLSGYNAFGSWLKRIVINNCITHLRNNRIVFEDIDNHFSLEHNDEEERDFSIDPAFVHHSIRGLPRGGRTILVLHALEGYKHREIAEMLGISESTSKTQYRRALALLNKYLKQKIYVT
jgi:RNA polymerase sigma factor (sigma-70 family)